MCCAGLYLFAALRLCVARQADIAIIAQAREGGGGCTGWFIHIEAFLRLCLLTSRRGATYSPGGYLRSSYVCGFYQSQVHYLKGKVKLVSCLRERLPLETLYLSLYHRRHRRVLLCVGQYVVDLTALGSVLPLWVPCEKLPPIRDLASISRNHGSLTRNMSSTEGSLSGSSGCIIWDRLPSPVDTLLKTSPGRRT